LSPKSFLSSFLICLAGSTLNPAQGNPSFAASANTFATPSQNVSNMTPALWNPAPNLTPASQSHSFNPTAYANGNGEYCISTFVHFSYYIIVFLNCVCRVRCSAVPNTNRAPFNSTFNASVSANTNVSNITPALWNPSPNLTPAPHRLAFNPTAYANGNGEYHISTGFLFSYYIIIFLNCVCRVRCSAVPNTMMFTPNSPQFYFPEYMSCPVTTPSAIQKQSVDHLATALSKFSIGVGGKQMSHRRGTKLRESFQSRHEQRMLYISQTAEEQGLLYSNHVENQDLRHTKHIESIRELLKESADAIREANDYEFLAVIHTESSPESVSDE
jgi:hypothetical protein